jgi:hypothetical protein
MLSLLHSKCLKYSQIYLIYAQLRLHIYESIIIIITSNCAMFKYTDIKRGLIFG